VEESVEVLASELVERDGERRRTYRLALGDGSTLEVSGAEPRGPWLVERRSEPT